MKTFFRLFAAIALLIASSAASVFAAKPERKLLVAGVAFYNLENLFDTIPNNPEGRDLEFTRNGQRQWDGRKYRQKPTTSPMPYRSSKHAPPLWVSGHNRSVRNRKPHSARRPRGTARTRQARPRHRASRLARRPKAWTLGLLYNKRYFRVENVTNHRLTAVPFRTRDQMCVVG